MRQNYADPVERCLHTAPSFRQRRGRAGSDAAHQREHAQRRASRGHNAFGEPARGGGYEHFVLRTSDGTEYTAVLPAGQAETTATVPTPVVKKRTVYAFTPSDGEGYTAGTGGEITLYPLPKVEFYQPIYVRKAGNDCRSGDDHEKQSAGRRRV